jgi:hypothetical protein
VPEYPAITFGTSGLAGRFLIAVLTAVPIFGHSVKTASGRTVFTRLTLSGSPFYRHPDTITDYLRLATTTLQHEMSTR